MSPPNTDLFQKSERTNMGRKGQSITLSLLERDKKQLEALAAEYGMTWGEKPNISRLLKAIAQGKLRIAPNHDWTSERIKALDTARKALVDAGKMEEAIEIAKLLQERSELTIPFQQEIDNFLETPKPAWQGKIDDFIHRQQPFRLTYQDAREINWQFTVRFAQIQFIEKRQYLVCRTDESEGNQDLQELSHNWTLRLDRIQDATVTAIDTPWLNDLERIEVSFELRGGLVFAYRSKPHDLKIEDIEDTPSRRRVTRSIFNTFWFFREIAAYYGDCVIVKPENVRSLYLEKVRSLFEQYQKNG
ncbi:WYL domain-containing protein [Crocosphaera sp. XPORK-15E]|uniref:WYL domain-containing protein n=1 Tax=Crocosphaera sp. XPORK-15E TaxID=3110247 RepID=UPI002B1FE45C|nr:WYL domain-containing protein [Crocosphaera sp. XPORK-15E]MEA5536877.1 WYL domain-containing protein [Crocosphaera sp. XPORK-15E]